MTVKQSSIVRPIKGCDNFYLTSLNNMKSNVIKFCFDIIATNPSQGQIMQISIIINSRQTHALDAILSIHFLI